MLKEAAGIKKVIICTGKTDLRKGVPGLAAILRLHFDMNAAEEGTLFLFCGSSKRLIKGIIYEGDGYVLISKRLLNGDHFYWPKDPAEARNVTIDQYRKLLDGHNIEGIFKSIDKYR